MGLGNTLLNLGNRERGTARLEEAVTAYDQTLQEMTRERVPREWAAAQHNLGNALLRLGERESGTARLKEAISAYQAALQEETRERVPLDWALSTGNQGEALMLIASRNGDVVAAESAVQQIQAASETALSAGHPQVSEYFQALLWKAQVICDRLKGK